MREMGLIDFLRRRIREAGAGSESSTDRDGAFSHAAETHAFAVGVHDGVRYPPPLPHDPPDHPDTKTEPHYYDGGYAVGTVIQFSFIVAVGVTIAVTVA